MNVLNKINTINKTKKLLEAGFIAVTLVMGVSACKDYTEDFPVPPASVVPAFTYESSREFSVPDTVRFTNLSIIPVRAVPATYQWDFGDGEISVDENPVHIYDSAAEYIITLTVVTPVDTVKTSRLQHFFKNIRFRENFEGIGLIPSNWVLANLDGNTPDNPGYASMKDSAWVIDRFEETFGGNVALGISFYNPEAAADDWMILPAVTIGETTVLSWDAQSMTTSGNYPDSYQIYVSTSTQDVDGCKANGIFFRVNNEEVGVTATSPGKGVQHREVNLSSRFNGKTIYVAFRLMTPEPGGDRLAIDNIMIYDE